METKNKNKEISNEEYQQLLDSLCGCLKDADNGEDYKKMIGDEIIKKQSQR